MSNSKQRVPNTEQLIQQRSSVRRSVLKTASIFGECGKFFMVCVVRDISKIAARVLVDKPDQLPETIILVLNQTNVHHKCDVIWRSKYEIGLRFIR